MGNVSFPGVKSGRGVILTPHPLLVPCSRKGRAIPVFPMYAVRLVQSLSAYTRVHFTFLPGFRISFEVRRKEGRKKERINKESDGGKERKSDETGELNSERKWGRIKVLYKKTNSERKWGRIKVQGNK
jgi:hypothetical protein